MDAIQLVHLADLHLGYSGPKQLVFSDNERYAGRYVREVDIEKAIEGMTLAIIRQQPAIDIVVIAGDMFHKSTPYPRAIEYATKLTHILRKNGIEVVIIDGNHETPSIIHAGSPISFLSALGAHVVNRDHCEIIRDAKWTSPRLQEARLAIHALPYRAVQHANFSDATPLPGYINILLAHGRVQGMEEFNSLHHPAARIPRKLLHQNWDYIALGDWHTHKHQPLPNIPAYYAGSLEALNYAEAKVHPAIANDPNAERGALLVELRHEQKVTVNTLQNTTMRPVLKLRPIDPSNMTSSELMQEIRSRFTATLPAEALAMLEIKDIPQSVWDELDFTEIHRLRQTVRRCNIRMNAKSLALEAADTKATEVPADKQWEYFLAKYADQDWLLKQSSTLIINAARCALQAQQARNAISGTSTMQESKKTSVRN
jgi:DNA repair exonuclease SbcCD nuclease subunit